MTNRLKHHVCSFRSGLRVASVLALVVGAAEGGHDAVHPELGETAYARSKTIEWRARAVRFGVGSGFPP